MVDWSLFSGLENAMPQLLIISILLVVAVVGLKIIDKLTRKMRGKFGDRLQFKLFSGLIQILFISVIILIMLAQIGVTEDFLKFLGLVITGLIAFSSTTLIANLVAGFILHVTHPFYIGDIIEIEGTLGKVIDVKSVYTEVYTFEKTKVQIPNSSFIKKNIINYSREGFRITSEVSLSYEINRINVENALIRAAKMNNLEDVFVTIKKLDNSYITYELNGTSRNADGIPYIKSSLNKTILDEFNTEKIEIASPSLIGHRPIKKMVTKAGKKQKFEWTKKQKTDLNSISKIVDDTFGNKPKKK